MKIESTGDQLSYHVHSETTDEVYLVDMSANGGRGQCSCRDFVCRRSLHKDERVVLQWEAKRNTCKHISALVAYLGKCVVARYHHKEVSDIFIE